MLRRILTISLLFCLCTSCDEDFTSTIPNVTFRFTLDLGNEDASLIGSLSYKEFTAPRRGTDTNRIGYGGLLVINGLGDNLVNLMAYDLACPNEAQAGIIIKPEDTGLTATCPKCGAVYRIATGGAPESGSKFWLRRYNVVQEPGRENRYIVTN